MSALGRLHLITDARPDRDTLGAVRATLRAGAEFGAAPTVQVRVPDAMTDREAYQLALRVAELCREAGSVNPAAVSGERAVDPAGGTAETAEPAPAVGGARTVRPERSNRPICLVNDRIHIALAVAADGAHTGADDLPVAAARRVIGDHAVLGATARDPATAREAVQSGASYLGVGPAYQSTTKDGLPDPIGPGGVAAVVAAVDVPVVAIGGVTVDRVAPLLAVGAYGVAVIGAINGAADPYAAASGFFKALRGGA